MPESKHRFYILPLSTLIVIALISGMGSTIYQSANAQSNPNRVGLVIQFKDGSIIKQCVEIEDAQGNGSDALVNAGLSIVYDFNAQLGAGVCKIENDGCDASEKCFCDSPNYWSYWHLGLNDQGQPAWEYSVLGASSYTVQAGDVEGWHYGMMAPPSEIPSFEQICAAPTATLAAVMPTATYPPTQVIIPPTTPPKWATAVIIGPTPEPLSPIKSAPTTAPTMAIPPTTAPTPTEALNALPPVVEGQHTATQQSAPTSPAWTATQPSANEPVMDTPIELESTGLVAPTLTEAHTSRLAMQEEQATPVDSSIVQSADPAEAAETDPSTGVSKWVLIFGGLAGVGSFIGFFLALLGGLLAVTFLRRR